MSDKGKYWSYCTRHNQYYYSEEVCPRCDAPDSDQVNKPAHYTAGRSIEPIDAIEDWQLPHHLACVVKYITRYERKGGKESLLKAQWYLNRFIERYNDR